MRRLIIKISKRTRPEKGAFTGALQQRQGRFEPHSGTLFLDEIGELPAETQIASRAMKSNSSKRLSRNSPAIRC